MKSILNTLLSCFLALSCNLAVAADQYFEFSIDGKEFKLSPDDVMTKYREGNAGEHEFKIFAGDSVGGPQLVLTIVEDISKPSSTPSGSAEPGNGIYHGSVSMQDYPEKGDVFNSYDKSSNPEPVKDAIVISSSEKIGEEGRLISGTINVKTVEAPAHQITGKFRIKHVYTDTKF